MSAPLLAVELKTIVQIVFSSSDTPLLAQGDEHGRDKHILNYSFRTAKPMSTWALKPELDSGPDFPLLTSNLNEVTQLSSLCLGAAVRTSANAPGKACRTV